MSDEQHQAPILLVDDRTENLTALRAILEPLGQQLVLASSGEEALRAMLRRDVAVVLLDVRMPGMDGFETAEVIRSRERSRHVPIIFLTAADADPGLVRRGYDAGAVDYLFKPFDPIVLRAKVRVFIDLHNLKRESERLAHRALHDDLTGLPNRTLFRDRLDIALKRTDREASTVAVLYIDLDGFKPVNDSFGHVAGDMLLVELAGRMRRALRPADTVARLGGDEFAVVSEPVEGETGAAHIAERLISTIEEPLPVPGGIAQVSASIGFALADAPVPPSVLLHAADAAMYGAKAAGGRGWRGYDASAGTRS